jgi:hypothetical protein
MVAKARSAGALVLASRYIITFDMIDATTRGHRHAHDHAGGEALTRPAHAHLRQSGRRQDRLSPLEASAGARLAGVSFVIALLWAGVYWALH